MRLLITTQAVDLDDPVLAFFHGWIFECARQFEYVEVICLKEGRHNLPKNVSVHSLGKESGRSFFKYVSRFYTYIWTLRKKYDAVFVHMNPEYVVLGGLPWRLMGKKVGLWYIHPKSSWQLRIAVFFSNRVMSASIKSFPRTTRKLLALGHGIDTGFFSPGGNNQQGDALLVMLAARVAPVKRVECVVGALGVLVHRDISFIFDYYGTELERDREYAETIRKLVPAAMPPGVWTWKGNATPEGIRDAYRSHDVHVNATDSGSFDKAVLESMSCGTLTVASNSALEGILPSELLFKEGDSKSLADVLEKIAHMSQIERSALSAVLRTIAEEKYSLSALVKNIEKALA